MQAANLASNRYSALSAVYSSATYRDLASESPSLALSRLARAASEWDAGEEKTLGDFLNFGLSILSKHYRNEYVFKNNIISKLVWGRHKPTTSSALLEFASGDSFADVLILNGSSTVYEIKTDLDSFHRLSSQVQDYKSRFEYVYLVVSSRKALIASEHLPDGAGLIAMHSSGRLQVMIPAPSNKFRLDAGHMFRSLRQGDIEFILSKCGILPVSSDPVEQWHARKIAFEALNPLEVHEHMVTLLRHRGQSAGSLATRSGFPRAALALAYGSRLSGSAQVRLLQRLALPLPLVLGS
ncbi:sce7726 family protein [Clavibacter michiganensis]|uniref:sce7726 family protein n=1 Tax=Clavibacter michiganensis TaxID=28447 RepID=UPI001365E4BE|nr:sce7726 family protein [Clavibacter michiganensis subsp. michiganensis]